MMDLALKALMAYLLGSVSGSLLLGRLRHVDIRTMGSGNAGGTNAFRTQGLIFAFGVVLLDVGKAVLATAYLPTLSIFSGSALADPETARLACGFMAIFGHCFPVFHGFRGGKGAATAAGSLAVIQPLLLIPMLCTWLIVLVLTGYVGLSTVLAGLSLVPATLYLGGGKALLTFTAAVALFMVFTHRGNLQRLLQGSENRFEKVRITHWFDR
jgi:glycerol-3-phosphate acyltransferase PlsY